MTPVWIKEIALAIGTAARTINTFLKSAENIADTAEAYTGVYRKKSIQALAAADLKPEDIN